MGDYYEILREIHESAEAYYLDQDHYDTEPDMDDWLTGPPWQEADEDTPF